jgi:hypothetical protein
VHLAPPALDAIAAWHAGVHTERALLRGMAALSLRPAPDTIGMRLEASYRADRLPLAVTARYLQVIPRFTPTVTTVGEVGLAVRYQLRHVALSFEYGHNWLVGQQGRGNYVTTLAISFPSL